MEAGPGFPVLNSLAARMLAECGMESVTLSVEADRRQLEEITAQCPVACSLVVFGRPALMTTRVRVPEEQLDKILEGELDEFTEALAADDRRRALETAHA
jgi:hypothetical protein